MIEPSGSIVATARIGEQDVDSPGIGLHAFIDPIEVARSDESTWMPVAFGPIAATAASSSARRRPVMKTRTPSAAKRLAVANPRIMQLLCADEKVRSPLNHTNGIRREPMPSAGLQGADVELSEEEKHIYEQVTIENGMRIHMEDHDVVIVHDPQPLPLRCHVETRRERIRGAGRTPSHVFAGKALALYRSFRELLHRHGKVNR